MLLLALQTKQGIRTTLYYRHRFLHFLCSNKASSNAVLNIAVKFLKAGFTFDLSKHCLVNSTKVGVYSRVAEVDAKITINKARNSSRKALKEHLYARNIIKLVWMQASGNSLKVPTECKEFFVTSSLATTALSSYKLLKERPILSPCYRIKLTLS